MFHLLWRFSGDPNRGNNQTKTDAAAAISFLTGTRVSVVFVAGDF